MLILFTLSRYRRTGGHENVIDNLMRGLASLGHETVLGAFSFEKEPPVGVRALRLSVLQNIPRFLENKREIDIVHNHHAKMNYYTLLSRRPFIFHCHGASSRLQEMNLKASLFLCRSRISKIIYVSNFAMSQAKRVSGPTAMKISSKVIRNGIDSTFFNLDVPKKYKVGDPQLLFVGNLYAYKNVTRILDEIPSILLTFPNVHFQIVGNGKQYEYIKEMIHARNLHKNVELLGGVTNDEDLRQLYSSCDIYVTASTYETVGMPLLEAMASGRPVLASDIPAHREIVCASRGGHLFSLSEKDSIKKGIECILDQREILASNGRKFAEDNDWSRVCKRISREYEEIAEPSK